MAEEQHLASQPTESQVVMAKELARLQWELQSAQDTLADEHNHSSLVSQINELEIQAAKLCLAHKQKQFPATSPSEGELQAVNGLSCSPTLAHQDELAAITDIATLQECSFHPQSLSDIYQAQADGSYTNPDSFPYPSVDCIQECLDTPVPNGIQQKLVLPRPKPRPQLSLKKDVPHGQMSPDHSLNSGCLSKGLVKCPIAQMFVKTHLYLPLPVRMYIMLPSVHPPSLTLT